MQTGHVLEFGSSSCPSGGVVGQAQNIFDWVRSWAWTSIPMIVSYVVLVPLPVPVLTAMRLILSGPRVVQIDQACVGHRRRCRGPDHCSRPDDT
jgi:hypothetical protein